MGLTKEQRFGPGPYIEWNDYWRDGDEPGETFLLVAWARGTNYYRAATVDDLRLARFVPAGELDTLHKRNEKLERVALLADQLVMFGSASPDYIDKAEVDLRHYYDLRAALAALDKEGA